MFSNTWKSMSSFPRDLLSSHRSKIVLLANCKCETSTLSFLAPMPLTMSLSATLNNILLNTSRICQTMTHEVAKRGPL